MSSANKVFINNSQFQALFDLKPNVRVGSIIENYQAGDQCFLECPLQFSVKPTKNININVSIKNNNINNKHGVLDFLFSDQLTTFYTASTNFGQPARIVNKIINIKNININNYHSNQRFNRENHIEDAREPISRQYSSKKMANVGSPNNNYISPSEDRLPVTRNLEAVEKRLQSIFVATAEEESAHEEQATRRVSCFNPIDNWIGKLVCREADESRDNYADVSGSDNGSMGSCFIPMVNNAIDSSTKKSNKGVETMLHKSGKTEEKSKASKHTKNEQHNTRSLKHDCAYRSPGEDGSVCNEVKEEDDEPAIPVPVRQNRAEMLFGAQQDERYETQNYEHDEENEGQGEERSYISFAQYEEMLGGYEQFYDHSSFIQEDEFVNYGASVREDPRFSISPEEYQFESTFEDSEYDRVKSQDEEDEEVEQPEEDEQPEKDEQPGHNGEVQQGEAEEAHLEDGEGELEAADQALEVPHQFVSDQPVDVPSEQPVEVPSPASVETPQDIESEPVESPQQIEPAPEVAPSTIQSEPAEAPPEIESDEESIPMFKSPEEAEAYLFSKPRQSKLERGFWKAFSKVYWHFQPYQEYVWEEDIHKSESEAVKDDNSFDWLLQVPLIRQEPDVIEEVGPRRVNVTSRKKKLQHDFKKVFKLSKAKPT
ncbi:hypothetical protein I9W82_003997 [Candida metapsilosis]|uniref:Uncharacterized protein n=1 Tax=Candida metapsilosis TaxID=273372 RepID=A0A8H7ZE04_9ASCO|nr:hypothetical protein I9W82_003997 [Candida metapsilosis]